MNARELKTNEDVRRFVEASGLDQIKVGVFDMEGVLCGKYMSRDKFLSSLDGGFGFCEVVLGWDLENRLYDNCKLTGGHTGYTDAQVRLLPDLCRTLPFENDMLMFIGEFTGRFSSLCPRGILRRVLERAESMGFKALAACEYEFLALDESSQSLRSKGYRSPKPLGEGNFGYSMLRNSVNTDFYRGLLDLCTAMDIPIEGLHEETGPGALEAAIVVDDALSAADKGALFKTFSKVFAQRQGRTLSFMAKWNENFSGQGGHVHMSLKDLDGNPVFHDPSKPDGISDTMRFFIGGLQRLLPEITALVTPSINSYRRLVPGYWAPTEATWGVDNRTVALRAIVGSAKSQRVEYRVPGADANPYLALASALAAGLWGIENRIEPDPMVTGNAYLQDAPEHQHLPRTLWDAAQRLRASTVAREWLGDDFVEHYAATREWEEREFRRHVSDWELNRYFEII